MFFFELKCLLTYFPVFDSNMKFSLRADIC